MKYLTLDAHCDTIQKICDARKELKENDLHIDLKRLQNLNHIQVFAAFIDKENDVLSPFQRANQLIDRFFEETGKNCDIIEHTINTAQAKECVSNGKTAAFLSIEGGEALEGSLDNLDYFYNRGVRLLTLTWNYDNELCTNEGLTTFGKEVVKRMNKLGMLVDVSHIPENGFRDVARICDAPFCASHSNAFSLKEHKRNLNDEQIKAIIKAGGCIGINLYTEFLTDGVCKAEDVFKHIDHILNLGGENAIGLGADFDGMDSLPEGIHGIESIPYLAKLMEKHNYPSNIIEKIMSTNFLSLFNKVFL